jgi:hypothetical protein
VVPPSTATPAPPGFSLKSGSALTINYKYSVDPSTKVATVDFDSVDKKSSITINCGLDVNGAAPQAIAVQFQFKVNPDIADSVPTPELYLAADPTSPGSYSIADAKATDSTPAVTDLTCLAKNILNLYKTNGMNSSSTLNQGLTSTKIAVWPANIDPTTKKGTKIGAESDLSNQLTVTFIGSSQTATAPATPKAIPSGPISPPSAPIPAPTNPIPAPSKPISAPSTPLPAPNSPVPAPLGPIQTPSGPIMPMGLAPATPYPIQIGYVRQKETQTGQIAKTNNTSTEENKKTESKSIPSTTPPSKLPALVVPELLTPEVRITGYDGK